MARSIEDIILGDDRRGVAALRPCIAPDFCYRAAQCALQNPGTAIITSGFYIASCAAPETDGPPGALALGRALESLGRRVVYVSDRYTLPILRPFLRAESQLVDFPITDDQTSREFASGLLSELRPSLLISIERCGLTSKGMYLNMRGEDISPHTARVDHLFLQHTCTIGIGDGGNEIGMGNLYEHIPNVENFPADPATTRTTHLVISSTSNWGAYGVVAALSLLAGRNLLPDLAEEEVLIRHMVDLGAVDGVMGTSRYSVDTMGLEEHGKALSQLKALLAEEGISP